MARLTVARGCITAGMIDCHQIPTLPMTGTIARASFARALAARFGERILWKCSIDQGLEGIGTEAIGTEDPGLRIRSLLERATRLSRPRKTGSGSRFAIALLCTWKSALFVD